MFAYYNVTGPFIPLIFLARQAILSSIVDDLNAFELVTDAMESFADSPQIQWFGCSLVAYLGLFV